MANGHKFKGDVRVEGNLRLPNETASRVPYLDSNNEFVSSAVTDVELAYVSGVTSSIQSQINSVVSDNTSTQNEVDDLVTLTGVPANSTDLGTFTGGIIADNTTIKDALQDLEDAVEGLPDPLVYKGTWDASTNTPTLANSDTGKSGYLYQVNVAGSVNFGAGSISFDVGDKVVNNGTIWEKWDMTDAVSSVNGQTGAVVLTTSNISEGSNLYFTDERAQDAVGNILTDSSKIDFTYDDSGNSITATIVAGSLVNADINASAAIARTKLASGSANHVIINDGSGVLSSEAQLATSRGGTGLNTSAASNGQLLIGNGSGLSLATLTAGANISITNGSGSITIAATGNANDIPDTQVAFLNNQVTPVDITGFAFANANVQAFKATISVKVDATADLFEVYTLDGIQKSANWEMAQMAVGDDSGVVFSITNAGQIQYTSSNYSGFVSGEFSFRAFTVGT